MGGSRRAPAALESAHPSAEPAGRGARAPRTAGRGPAVQVTPAGAVAAAAPDSRRSPAPRSWRGSRSPRGCAR